MLNSTIGLLRIIGILEGISYLGLLFIAMPLKYFANLPTLVPLLGMTHGILFVLFVLILLVVWYRHRWSLLRVTGAFLASLLPFGTFLLDVRLKRELESRSRVWVKEGLSNK